MMAESSEPEPMPKSEQERLGLVSQTPDVALDSNFFCVIDGLRKSFETMVTILNGLGANGRTSVNRDADNELQARWVAHSTAAKNMLRDIDLYIRVVDEKVRKLLVGS